MGERHVACVASFGDVCGSDRECDTDGEPGLNAREIATLIQSLGYLPDMACTVACDWELACQQ